MNSNLRFGDTVRIDEDFPTYGGKVGTIVNRSTPPKGHYGEPIVTKLEWGIPTRYVRLKGSGEVVMIGAASLIKERV